MGEEKRKRKGKLNTNGKAQNLKEIGFAKTET